MIQVRRRRRGGPKSIPILLLALAACSGTGSEAPLPAERPTPVATITTELRDLADDHAWAGSLGPLRVHTLQAPVAARVLGAPVADGSSVAAGSVVLILEGIDQSARRQVLEEREARLGEEVERWRRLADAGAAGPSEVLAAELLHSQTLEALVALQATGDALTLRAGVAGRVVNLQVATGMLVTTGQPLLAVEERNSFGVRLRVSASEAHRLADAERLGLETRGGDRIPVSRVVQASDAQPGFVQVDLYAAEADTLRSQGVTVRSTSSERAMVLPWTSVATEEGRSWVAVATPEPAGEGAPRYRVERRPVELGQARPGGIEVVRGLVAGERVLRYEPRSHPEGRWVEPRDTAGAGDSR
jgi:biotin carboxyl carrier protein